MIQATTFHSLTQLLETKTFLLVFTKHRIFSKNFTPRIAGRSYRSTQAIFPTLDCLKCLPHTYLVGSPRLMTKKSGAWFLLSISLFFTHTVSFSQYHQHSFLFFKTKENSYFLLLCLSLSLSLSYSLSLSLSHTHTPLAIFFHLFVISIYEPKQFSKFSKNFLLLTSILETRSLKVFCFEGSIQNLVSRFRQVIVCLFIFRMRRSRV